MTRDEDHEAMWPANRILLVGHLIIVVLLIIRVIIRGPRGCVACQQDIIVILVHKDIIIISIGHNSRIVIILLVGRNTYNSHQIRIL